MTARALVACEESGTVCFALRAAGVEAYSCDLKPTSGSAAQWHIQGDALALLDDDWDLLIAHPPCENLCNIGRITGGDKRGDGREDAAADFFMRFANAPARHICIENPVGAMSRRWRKPDQIVSPHQFGHPYSKKTCLWLKNLPPLTLGDVVAAPVEFETAMARIVGRHAPDRRTLRSRTAWGLAAAMAAQWGSQLTAFSNSCQ